MTSSDDPAPHQDREPTHDPVPDGGRRGDLHLDLAVAQLRARPTDLPEAVADRALQRALTTPRPAELVRAAGLDGALRVSTVALVALLRWHLEAGLEHAAVRRVRCTAGRDERLEGVTVELIVEFGQDVRAQAAAVHELASRTLREVLGTPEPPGGPVDQHVHVVDVTVGDPHLVDPFDEQ